MDIARETAYHFKLPSILLGLGYSASGLGDCEIAKIYFRECLTLLSLSKVQILLFNALIGWAENETAMGNYQKAAQVLGFVQTQTHLDEEDQQELAEALERLKAKLSLRDFKKYLEQGKMVNLDQVFKLVLASADSSPAQATNTHPPQALHHAN